MVLIQFNSFFKFKLLIVILLVVSFIVQFQFQSQWLECWDSVQFTMAILDYSVPAHQPHPPGFPVYIVMGKLINFILNDPQQSLILVSIITGISSIYLTYILGSKLFNEHVGFLAAFLLSICPAQLQFSVIVMADIVNQFIVVLILTLVIFGLANKKFFYIGLIILGLSFGIRPTDSFIILVSVFIYIVIKNRKEFIKDLLFVFSGFLLWFIPFIIYNNLYEFIKASIIHLETASEVSSFARGGINKSLQDFFMCLVNGWSISIVVLCIIALIAIIIFWKEGGNPIKKTEHQYIILGLFSALFLGYCIILLNLYIPRYILPLFPIIAIISAASIIYIYNNIKNKPILKSIFIIIVILICIPMVFSSFSIINGLHNIKPAPVEAAYYIKNNYSANNTILLTTESMRHFQYYLPNYSIRNVNRLSDEDLLKFIENAEIIISEREFLFYGSSCEIFIRDPHIYPRLECVKLYIHKPSEQKFWILNGWYGLEFWDNIPTRWISQNATLLLYSNKSDQHVTLNFTARSFYRLRTLEIYANNALVKQIGISTNFTDFSIPIHLQQGKNLINLSVIQGGERPCDIPELKSRDIRELSVAVRNISVGPKQTPSNIYDVNNLMAVGFPLGIRNV